MVYQKVIGAFIFVLIIFFISCDPDVPNNKEPVKVQLSLEDWFDSIKPYSKDTLIYFEFRQIQSNEAFKVTRTRSNYYQNLIIINEDSVIYSDKIIISYKTDLYPFDFDFTVIYNYMYGHSLFINYIYNQGWHCIETFLDTGEIKSDDNWWPKFLHPNFVTKINNFYNGYKVFNEVYEIDITTTYGLDDPNDICKFYLNKQYGIVKFEQLNNNTWCLIF